MVTTGLWMYSFYTLNSVLGSTIPNDKIECFGVIEKVRTKIKTQHLVVASDGCAGKVLVVTSLYPEHSIGDHIEFSGSAKKPEVLNYTDAYGYDRSFEYDRWLAMQGIGLVMIYPIIASVPDATHSIERYLYVVKQKVTSRVLRLIPGSEGSLLNGILLGEQDRIDPHIADIFRRTGISHIVALSGFNITIIAVFFLRAAPYLYIGRKSAIALTVVAIFLFTILTGASASIVRAAIMGSLTVMAYVIGRPQSVIPLVLFSAASMTIVRPLIVLYDVGFQLSFAATLGLIVLYPRVERIIRFIPKILGLREVVGATLVALIVTTPISMSTFGTVSPVSLLANILVVPLIPWIMAVGSVLLIVSFVPIINTTTTVVTWVGLKVVIGIVDTLTRIPQSYIVFESISWMVSLSVYACLIFVALFIHRKFLKNIIRSI
ncbi:MAG: ComEC/Rec2 family competence protein [Patescibacteria group bacterium]